ncbi:hypothetical protein GCM10023238_09040 [Streptomyces heliomycini]
MVTIHQHPRNSHARPRSEGAQVATGLRLRRFLPETEKRTTRRSPNWRRRSSSFEKILDAEPDSSTGGYGSALRENEGRSRKERRSPTPASTLNTGEYCGKKRVTMEDTYDEIRTIGEVFVSRTGRRAGRGPRGPRRQGRRRVSRASPSARLRLRQRDKSAFTAGGKKPGHRTEIRLPRENVSPTCDAVLRRTSLEQLVVAPQAEVIAVYDYADAAAMRRRSTSCSPSPRSPTCPPSGNKRFVVLR